MPVPELLRHLRRNPQLTVGDTTCYNLIMPYLTWEPDNIERTFAIALPPQLRELWTTAATAALCLDALYGQWGMILWSPERVLQQQQSLKSLYTGFQNSDLIIGEFLGDSDLLLMRCDPNADDFGHIIVALPVYPRHEWVYCGASLSIFLQQFLENPGKKPWE